MKTAQTRLGHADARTTLGIYAQATAQADVDAAERVGERFRPRRFAEVRPSRGMDAGCASEEQNETKEKVDLTRYFLVGKAGFEPAASASRTLRANQAALLPVGRTTGVAAGPHRS